MGGGREGEREGEREGGRKGGREGGREGGKRDNYTHSEIDSICLHTTKSPF